MAAIEAIQSVYLESNAARSITFESLGSYDHLQLRMTLKTLGTNEVHGGEMRFGDSAGISTSGYSAHRMYGENTTVSASISEGVDAAQFYPVCSSHAAVNAAEYSTHILNILSLIHI